jgi:hypothetical protein
MKLSSLVTIAAVALLTACSSTKPTQTALQPVQQMQEINAPEWFNSPPASTKDVLYVTGTSNSVNYGSSRNKALLDAQVQLGDKLNGEMNALIQQYQNDAGDSYSSSTTTNVKKLIAGTDLTGFSIDRLTTIKVGTEFQTFVLLRYPLGEANELMKRKLAGQERKELNLRARQGQIDLQRELDRKANAQREQESRVQQIIAPDTVKRDTPPAVRGADTVPTSTGELKLVDVDNAEYRARRAEALQKPGAVVGNTVLPTN